MDKCFSDPPTCDHYYSTEKLCNDHSKHTYVDDIEDSEVVNVNIYNYIKLRTGQVIYRKWTDDLDTVQVANAPYEDEKDCQWKNVCSLKFQRVYDDKHIVVSDQQNKEFVIHYDNLLSTLRKPE